MLDWELSTLGHPLSDLANLMQPYSLSAPDPSPSVILDPEERTRQMARGETMMLLGDLPEDVSPVPPKETLIKAYCKGIGREYPIPGWTFCEAWAWFRNAVIGQGIAARVAQGQVSVQ